jgi:hypothetical protein
MQGELQAHARADVRCGSRTHAGQGSRGHARCDCRGQLQRDCRGDLREELRGDSEQDSREVGCRAVRRRLFGSLYGLLTPTLSSRRRGRAGGATWLSSRRDWISAADTRRQTPMGIPATGPYLRPSAVPQSLDFSRRYTPTNADGCPGFGTISASICGSTVLGFQPPIHADKRRWASRVRDHICVHLRFHSPRISAADTRRQTPMGIPVRDHICVHLRSSAFIGGFKGPFHSIFVAMDLGCGGGELFDFGAESAIL